MKVSRESMQKRRGVNKQGLTGEGLTLGSKDAAEELKKQRNRDQDIWQGTQDPGVEFIKQELGQVLVKQIESVHRYYVRLSRPSNLEETFNKAYEYKLWKENNYVSGQV